MGFTGARRGLCVLRHKVLHLICLSTQPLWLAGGSCCAGCWHSVCCARHFSTVTAAVHDCKASMPLSPVPSQRKPSCAVLAQLSPITTLTLCSCLSVVCSVGRDFMLDVCACPCTPAHIIITTTAAAAGVTRLKRTRWHGSRSSVQLCQQDAGAAPARRPVMVTPLSVLGS